MLSCSTGNGQYIIAIQSSALQLHPASRRGQDLYPMGLPHKLDLCMCILYLPTLHSLHSSINAECTCRVISAGVPPDKHVNVMTWLLACGCTHASVAQIKTRTHLNMAHAPLSQAHSSIGASETRWLDSSIMCVGKVTQTNLFTDLHLPSRSTCQLPLVHYLPDPGMHARRSDGPEPKRTPHLQPPLLPHTPPHVDMRLLNLYT